MHLLVFFVGGHLNFDVLTGFFHAEKPAGFHQEQFHRSTQLTRGFYNTIAITQMDLADISLSKLLHSSQNKEKLNLMIYQWIRIPIWLSQTHITTL